MTRRAAILDRVISPAEAVEILFTRGVKVSERTLREKARRIGAYREVGQAMFFLPEDLEKIMEPQPCSRPKGARKARTGYSAGPSTAGASKSVGNGQQRQTLGAQSRASSQSIPPIRLVTKA